MCEASTKQIVAKPYLEKAQHKTIFYYIFTDQDIKFCNLTCPTQHSLVVDIGNQSVASIKVESLKW
jgi:hypothetical protein